MAFRHAILLLSAVFVLLAGCGQPSDAPAATPQRVVSLSPSCSEVLGALGLTERIVGVDKFSRYPAELQGRPKVGGFMDTDFEAIVGLHPDLVVLPRSHEEGRRKLETLRIPTLSLDHATLDGVVASCRETGRRFGIPERGERVAAALETALAPAPRPEKPLRALVCISRDYAVPELRDLYFAGNDGIYSRLLEALGAENACGTLPQTYPCLDRENLLQIDPDVIFDIVTVPNTDAKIRAQAWQTLPGLKAVRDHRVYCFEGDYATVPGPRLVLLIEDFRRAITPPPATP